MNGGDGSGRKYRGALMLGTNLVAGMIFFAGAGYVIGLKSGHLKLGVLVGVFLGFVYEAYEVWKAIRAIRNG